MPRKYIRLTPPGTKRQRDEKGRLLPVTPPAVPVRKKPGPKPKVAAAPPPTPVLRKKPGPKPGFKRKPLVPVPPPVDWPTPPIVAAVEKPVPPPPPPVPPDGLYPSKETWERLETMAAVIHASTMKPGWMMSKEQVLTTLLRGYEMRVGPVQIIWNTFLGEDGRPLGGPRPSM